MTRKKDIADQIADKILGPAPPKRGRGRPPGTAGRPLSEAELEQRRAAAAKRFNFAGRPRTVDQAWAKAMAAAASRVRVLARVLRETGATPLAELLEKMACEFEASHAPEKR